MSELKKKTCEPCRTGAPQASKEEIEKYQPQIPKWEIIETDGIKRLIRKYIFEDFVRAIEFTNKVGELAEASAHEPLDGEHRVLGVGHGLPASDLSDDSLAVGVEGNHAGGRTSPLGVDDDRGVSGLCHADAWLT